MRDMKRYWISTVASVPLALGMAGASVSLAVIATGAVAQAQTANPCNPCAAGMKKMMGNPCAAHKPMMGNPCNPCAAGMMKKKKMMMENPCAAGMKKGMMDNPCNPCAPGMKKMMMENPCNPCAAKKAMNPCAPANPCAAKKKAE